MFLTLSVRCFSSSNFALVFFIVAVLEGVLRCWTIGALYSQLRATKSYGELTYLDVELKTASR